MTNYRILEKSWVVTGRLICKKSQIFFAKKMVDLQENARFLQKMVYL